MGSWHSFSGGNGGGECSEEEDKRKTLLQLTFLFFNRELLTASALWPHVGSNIGRNVGGWSGEEGGGVCPMPVTVQGPPEKGQGGCHCIFWAQKLMKLGYFRKQRQNLVQHVPPPQDSWPQAFIRVPESDREPTALGARRSSL